MLKYEDECVGCPPEMGCLGDSCPKKNVPKHYCDICGESTEAEFLFNGEEELCRDCVEEMLEKLFTELSVEDRAQALGIELEIL